jgi:ATP-dependent protease ClpP protease subunit
MDYGSLEARLVTQKGERMAVFRFFGAIGPPRGFRASEFINSLSRLGDYDVLYTILDSSGGSAVEAWIIYDALTKSAQRHRSLVLITNECSGTAILIALAFEQILMLRGASIGFLPVELPRVAAARQLTQSMARLIGKRIGRPVEDVLGWMDKNKKFTAEECLSLSLCDAIV